MMEEHGNCIFTSTASLSVHGKENIMANQIERDVYVTHEPLKNPISYVRGTDAIPIVFHFRDYDIPSGASVSVFVAKPSGKAVYNSAAISGNDVTVTVDPQMFMELGTSEMQVSIMQGGKQLAQFAQPVWVKPNLKAGDFPPSTSSSTFLDDMIAQAQEAVDSATQAASDAQTAVQDANTALEDANNALNAANEAISDIIGKIIDTHYALRRTGKVYQTKLWKFATNPSSTGVKQLDNAGLVFEPSTDTEEGQDDYLNGQNPLFEWVNVNYVRDDDGTPRPIAIEGMDNYKTDGAVDVGAMQMSFWWRWDTSNAEYDLITISDMPHPELGLQPWVECVKADGTVVPWCIGSKYISGTASDGKLRSQPGLKPAKNQSHNNMITNYQSKGDGYWGSGACRNVFQFIFNAIKGGTKNSQTLYAGCTSYNYQYEAAIQSAEAHTYFPVANSQAGNLVVGSYVSVGYAGNNNGAENRDREQATVHSYADDVKILSIETLDENNMAVYLDLPEENAFSTAPHVYTEEFSAPIILSTMHWWSGSTDAVRGRHDGSLGSNTDGKHPYRVQGREYMVGGYIVASDTVMDLQADYTKKVLVAPKGVAHSSSNATIRSTYTQIGTIPAAAAGNNADMWVGDYGIDDDTGAWWPATEGSGSSQGAGDRVYAGGSGATSGTREYMQGGNLRLGPDAGSACLVCGFGLGDGGWYSLSCD